MAVLIATLVQVVGLALLSIGFGLWLGWPALFICAGACAVLFGIAMEPLTRKAAQEESDGSGSTD